MKNKTKLISIILVLGVSIFIGIGFFLNSNSGKETKVKIIDYGFSICTQDIAASDCGPYKVTVQSTGSKNTVYQAAGYSNQESKQYDEIRAKIIKAKEQNAEVIIKVNKQGEIVSVR